jgi:hypothetical protein
VLGLEVDDGLAYVRRQRGAGRALLTVGEQADHAQFFKALDTVIEAAARHAGFQGALGRRLAEQDDGAQHLITLLLGPGAACAQLEPLL